MLDVSESGYYVWQKSVFSKCKRRDMELADQIEHAHEENRQVYGSQCFVLKWLVEQYVTLRFTVIFALGYWGQYCTSYTMVGNNEGRVQTPVREGRLPEA